MALSLDRETSSAYLLATRARTLREAGTASYESGGTALARRVALRRLHRDLRGLGGGAQSFTKSPQKAIGILLNMS